MLGMSRMIDNSHNVVLKLEIHTEAHMWHNEMQVTSQDHRCIHLYIESSQKGWTVLCLWVRLHAACNLC